mmetsp:Transcript_25091/g.22248  ORF Transcript_25091/g.22248 Transcript_25091/m.22248 type:complete len:169 (+) Transcript_25091:2-508(+)
MTGVWKVDIKELDPKAGGARADYDFEGTKSAWKYDFHRSIYGKMDNSPFQHHVEDKPSLRARPKTSVTADMPIAGVFSWPFTQKNTIESSVTCLGADNLLSKTGSTTNEYAQNQFPNVAPPQSSLPTNGNGAPAMAPQYTSQVPVQNQPEYQASPQGYANSQQQFYQQ